MEGLIRGVKKKFKKKSRQERDRMLGYIGRVGEGDHEVILDKEKIRRLAQSFRTQYVVGQIRYKRRSDIVIVDSFGNIVRVI